MKPIRLRTKLTLFFAATVALLLSGFGIFSYHVLAVRLENALGDELTDLSSGLRAYLRFNDDQPVFLYDKTDPDQVLFVRSATRYFQIYDLTKGTLVSQSPELESMGVGFSPDEIMEIANGVDFTDVDTDQDKIRFRNDQITAASGQKYLLQVGLSRRSVDGALSEFLETILWLIPGAALITAGAGWWMAGKALQPVRALASTARKIAVSNLSLRLPMRGTNDELDTLAQEFNETLSRLESAVGEMKQFTGSIAHELRTPLAVLRGEAEIALMQARSEKEYRQILSSQLEEFEKLTRMINQLLTLARAESGEVKIAHQPVDLAELACSLVEQLSVVAHSKDILLECNNPQCVTVAGDRAWLECVVLNLLDNAIKFTPTGGHVKVAVSPENGNARLEVTDTGTGIPAEAVPHLFERFYRADTSRPSGIEGAGLGLSIVKWAVLQHHGTVRVESLPAKGSRFTVLLPLFSD